jgi:tight adherence protein B
VIGRATASAGAACLAYASVWLAGRSSLGNGHRIASQVLSEPVDVVSAPSRRVLGVALATGLVWSLRAQGPRILLLAGGAAAVGWVGHRLLADWRLRQARGRSRAAVVEFCDALAAELEAGLPAVTAMERACESWPALSSVVGSARLGDDVGVALRHCAASTPGAEGLRSVAAAWDVAAHPGAALARVLARVAAGLRSDEEARAEVTAALGPPRATAKLLAVLPVFGIALGASMGADPVGFLLQSTPGVMCLAAGTALALTGLWWVERLAAAIEV